MLNQRGAVITVKVTINLSSCGHNLCINALPLLSAWIKPAWNMFAVPCVPCVRTAVRSVALLFLAIPPSVKLRPLRIMPRVVPPSFCVFLERHFSKLLRPHSVVLDVTLSAPVEEFIKNRRVGHDARQYFVGRVASNMFHHGPLMLDGDLCLRFSFLSCVVVAASLDDEINETKELTRRELVEWLFIIAVLQMPRSVESDHSFVVVCEEATSHNLHHVASLLSNKYFKRNGTNPTLLRQGYKPSCARRTTVERKSTKATVVLHDLH